MKTNTLLTIIIVLLVILIGLLFYLFVGQDKKQDTQHTELTTQVTQSKEQVVDKIGQSEQQIISHIDQELDFKNEEKLAELKQIAFDYESIQLANSAISHLKMEMQMYLADRGQLPTSLAELNLPHNWTPSSKIKSVTLDSRSVVTITIDNAQSKGTLIFTPSIHQESYIDWSCATPDIKEIGLHLPTCEYTGQ